MTNRRAFLLSAVGLIFLSGISAKASWDLVSGFVVTVPSAAVDKQLYNFLQNNSQVQIVLPDQSYMAAAGVRVALSGITAALNYQVGNFNTIVSGQSWSMDSGSVSAVISIGAINATQTVQETVDGVNLNLQLNAVCGNVTLTLPASSPATLSSNVALGIQNGEPDVALSGFNVAWPSGAWQLGAINCSGAQGFGDLVNQEITQLLASPQGLQAALQNDIQNYIDQNISKAFSDLFHGLSIATGRTDVLLSMTSQSLSAFAGDYQLQGIFHLMLPLAFPGQTVQTAAGPLPSSVASGAATTAFLTLPEDVVSQFLAHVQQTSLLDLNFTSNDYPAISGLVHSFWTKLFVFPDLFHFSGDAVFNFQTAFDQPIAFSPDDQGTVPVPQFQGTVSGTFTTETLAPKNNQYVNYVQFGAGVASRLTLTVAAGILSCQPAKTKVNLQATWDPTYVATYHPWKDIDTGAIAGGIQATLNKAPLTYQLPNLSAGSFLSLQATQLIHDPQNQIISVYFDSPAAPVSSSSPTPTPTPASNVSGKN